MPTYEYECDACDVRWARHRARSSRSRCPECGKKADPTITGGLGFSFNQPDGVPNPVPTRRRNNCDK